MPKEKTTIVDLSAYSRQAAERAVANGQDLPESRIYGNITLHELSDLARDGYGGAIGWKGHVPEGFA